MVVMVEGAQHTSNKIVLTWAETARIKLKLRRYGRYRSSPYIWTFWQAAILPRQQIFNKSRDFIIRSRIYSVFLWHVSHWVFHAILRFWFDLFQLRLPIFDVGRKTKSSWGMEKFFKSTNHNIRKQNFSTPQLETCHHIILSYIGDLE